MSSTYSSRQVETSKKVSHETFEFLDKWGTRRIKVELFIEGLRRKVHRAEHGEASWNGVSRSKKDIIEGIVEYEKSYQRDLSGLYLVINKAKSAMLENESGEFLGAAIKRAEKLINDFGDQFMPADEFDHINDELATRRAASTTPTPGSATGS